MKHTRILAVASAFAALLVFAMAIYWYLLGGQENARRELVEILRPQLGASLDINSVQIRPNRVVIRGVSIDPSPSLHISIKSAVIRGSIVRSAFNWPALAGAIEELELVSPHLTVHASTDSTDTTTFHYSRKLLQSLASASIVRRIRISDGSFAESNGAGVILDDLNGLIDLTEPVRSSVSLRSRLPSSEGGMLSVNGSADLEGGSVDLACQVSLPDLAKLTQLESALGLPVEGGSAQLMLHLWGEEQLFVSGDGTVKGGAFGLGKGVKVANLDGELHLFGRSASAEFSGAVNGLKAQGSISVPDIALGDWSVLLMANATDLSAFDGEVLGLPKIVGTAEVTGDLRGDSGGITGRFTARSRRVEVERVELTEVETSWKLDGSSLRCESLVGDLYGNAVSATGLFDLARDSLAATVILSRQVTPSELPPWWGSGRFDAYVTTAISHSKGHWSISGGGAVRDSSGSPVATITTALTNGVMEVKAIPVDRVPVQIAISYDPDRRYPLDIAAQNAHFLAAGLTSDSPLLDLLKPYDTRISASVSSGAIKASVEARSETPERQLTVELEGSRLGNIWPVDAAMDLTLPEAGRLKGTIQGAYEKGTIRVRHGVLAEAGGRKVMVWESDPKRTSLGTGSWELHLSDLPIADFARLYNLPIPKGFEALVSGSVKPLGDAVKWNMHSEIRYPDSYQLVLSGEGELRGTEVNLSYFRVSNTAADTTFLSVSGRGNTSPLTLDSVGLVSHEFPIERLYQALFPSDTSVIRGKVNARAVLLDWPLSRRLDLDLHLTGGEINGVSGLWANVRTVAGDSSSRIEVGEMGRGEDRALTLTGWVGRSGAERISATGRGSDLHEIVQAAARVDLPLTGRADFKLDWVGGDQPRQVSGVVKVRSGQFLTIPYDSLTAHLTFVRIDRPTASLVFDSLKSSFGKVEAVVAGELPFDGNRSITGYARVSGLLPSILPRIDDSFSNPAGSGELFLIFGGSPNHPRITNGRLKINEGGVDISDVIPNLRHLMAEVNLTPDGHIRIAKCTANIAGAEIKIGTREAEASQREAPLVVGDYDLGVLQVATDPAGFEIVIPGLMRTEWGGRLSLAGTAGRESFELSGPTERPYAAGTAKLSNAIVTFPFLPANGKPSAFGLAVGGLLERIHWNASVAPAQGCRYIRELSGLGDLPGWDRLKERTLGGLLDPDVKVILDVQLDDNPQGLQFEGSVIDTLHLSGELTSNSGSVEFLDLKFDVDQLSLQFNPEMTEPMVSGSASTTYIDTAGISRTVRLGIHAGDSRDRLDTQKGSAERTSLSEINITLADDEGHSQEQILAALGYAPAQIGNKLSGLGGRLVENATPLRRWTRYLERQAEQWTGLDRVSIETSVAKNLIERQFLGTANDPGNSSSNPYWSLFYGTRLTLGKYLLPNWFLSYSGTFATTVQSYNATQLGFLHDFDLLYRLSRISNNLTLTLRYEYNNVSKLGTGSLFFRYGWIFDFGSQLRLSSGRLP